MVFPCQLENRSPLRPPISPSSQRIVIAGISRHHTAAPLQPSSDTRPIGIVGLAEPLGHERLLAQHEPIVDRRKKDGDDDERLKATEQDRSAEESSHRSFLLDQDRWPRLRAKRRHTFTSLHIRMASKEGQRCCQHPAVHERRSLAEDRALPLKWANTVVSAMTAGTAARGTSRQQQAHRSISPNTMSSAPMIAGTSARVWPLHMKSSASRWT